MARYVAFLRGVNVGGNNLIKMAGLKQKLESIGFGNVSTFKASGNLIFDAQGSEAEIVKKIRGAIAGLMGKEIEVILRTFEEIRLLAKAAPPQAKSLPDSPRPYVVFMASAPKDKPVLPMKSPQGDVEVVSIKNREAFSFPHKIKGKYGFPNKFIEDKFGIVATTRNWQTVKGIAGLR